MNIRLGNKSVIIEKMFGLRERKGYSAVEVMIVVSIISVLLLSVFLVSIYRARELKRKALKSSELRSQGQVSVNELDLGKVITEYRSWMDTQLYQRNMDPTPQDVVLYRISQGIRYDSNNITEANKIALSLVRAAILKTRSGQLKDAKELLVKASLLNPIEPKIYIELGKVGLLGEDLKFASEQVKAVLSMDPDYADAYILRARILMKKGNFSEAFEDLKLAAIKVQSSAELFLAWSEYHLKKGNLELSKDYAEKFSAIR